MGNTMTWREEPIIDFKKSWNNYILKFYKYGLYDIEDIQKIGAFQQNIFKFLNILKECIPGEYRVKMKDPLFETMVELDRILWGRCQKIRGKGSGL